MKSVVMAFYFLSISLGNTFTSAVNYGIATPGHGWHLVGADYFWFFTVVMLVAALVYLPVARLYRGRTYLQGTETANVGEAGG
jgi:POT family proton-dependent oligopeptide transporter